MGKATIKNVFLKLIASKYNWGSHTLKCIQNTHTHTDSEALSDIIPSEYQDMEAQDYRMWKPRATDLKISLSGDSNACQLWEL